MPRREQVMWLKKTQVNVDLCVFINSGSGNANKRLSLPTEFANNMIIKAHSWRGRFDRWSPLSVGGQAAFPCRIADPPRTDNP